MIRPLWAAAVALALAAIACGGGGASSAHGDAGDDAAPADVAAADATDAQVPQPDGDDAAPADAGSDRPPGADGDPAEAAADTTGERPDAPDPADAPVDAASDGPRDRPTGDAAADGPGTEAGTGTRVVQIATGGRFTCALVDDGTVLCWGYNYDGELGDGTTMNRATPAPVMGLPWRADAIAAGSAFACALHAGAVACWGLNNGGQLGDGTLDSRGVPAPVPRLDGVRAIFTGSGNHVCVLLDAGTVKCWGANSSGQLGDGSKLSQTAPANVMGLADARALALQGQGTCALTRTDTVRCWGYGPVGDGTSGLRLTPQPALALDPVATLGAGGGIACVVLRTEGRALCWGDNSHGQLGDGTNMPRLSPTSPSGLTGAIAVTGGIFHTCALMADGTVQCWGYNQGLQLGVVTPQYMDRWTPAPVPGVAGAVAISAGWYHTCVLLGDGSVECWGESQFGQAGPGTPGAPWRPGQ